MGTRLGVWQDPNQVDGWQLVLLGKFGAWALLVSMSFVPVATAKAVEGRFYGEQGVSPSVDWQPRPVSGSTGELEAVPSPSG
jgi:Protein of unknown function (DUF817)